MTFGRGRTLDLATKRAAISAARSMGWARTIFALVHLALCMLAILCLTGQLSATYAWLNRFFQPEVWSAVAAWVTVGIAAGAFVYAKRQVQEARHSRVSQEKHARESLDQQALLAQRSLGRQRWDSREALRQQRMESSAALRQQERAIDEQRRIAQESSDEQARQAQLTRDEMAQPNVMIFAEPNPADWQILEIIIKNFGNTPAYGVSVILDSPLQSLPNNISNGENYDIPIPVTIPVLAPGQQWTTVWDSAVERHRKRRVLRHKLIQNYPGGPPSGTDIDAEVETFMPRSRHTATVQYTDSKGKIHHTKSFLDFNMLDGSMRAKTYGIHDIAKKYVGDVD